MGLTIIIRSGTRTGMKVRRSDKERVLEKEGWGSSLSEEQIDKLDYLERKIASSGRETPIFIKGKDIDRVE